jgi:hypothetical protein
MPWRVTAPLGMLTPFSESTCTNLKDFIMSFPRWLSSLQRRIRSQKSSPRRRNPVLLGSVRDWFLEDRCLLSGGPQTTTPLADPSQTTIYVAGNPNEYKLNTVADPKSVIFLGGTSPNTGDFQWGTVPTKLVTITNNSSTHQTIYPFLYDHNDTKSYDPIDTTGLEYRIYIGYNAGTAEKPIYTLGLPYDKSITIKVPLVFWNAGRADIAVDSTNLIPKNNNSGTVNPFFFFYDSTMSVSSQGVTESTDKNGILLYYRSIAGPHSVDPSSAAQAQLTEWTIRDQAFLTKVNTYIDQYNSTNPPTRITRIADSQLTTLFNYDVSYVDAMLAPVAMTALSVPVPIQYILGVSTAAQSGNTTTIKTSKDNAAQFASLFTMLTSTYNYQKYEWDVKYNDTSKSPTVTYELGKVNSITKNPDGSGSVTVTWTSSGSAPKLPAGADSFVFYTNAVTQDYGWTGANNDIGSMQKSMSAFTTNSVTQAAASSTQSADKKTTTITLKADANLPPLLKLLTTTYPYGSNQWQVFYNVPSSNQLIVVGNITRIVGNTVTVQSSAAVSGLPAGAASYAFSVNGLGEYFATQPNPGGRGWPEYYNSAGNALLKIPSGANVMIDGPLTTKTSPYDINHWLLTSSGDFRISYGALITSSTQDLKPGVKAVFHVAYSTTFTPADLQAMYNANVAWNVTFATNPFGTIQSIDPTAGTITILMNNTIKYNASGYAGNFTAPVSDPFTTKLTNLWYSWAQYYVNQYSASKLPKSVTVSATVSSVPKSEPADYRLLTLTKAGWDSFGPNGPQLGMLLNGTKFSGQNITIVKVAGPTTADPNNYQIYLSAPVPKATTSFTFLAPTMTTLVGSTDKGLQTNLIDPNGFGDNKAFATEFAATIYEMLSVYSTVSPEQLKATLLPSNSMAVVYEAIGGNVGFLPTAQPVNYADISADVRDLGKSVLRGVPNYLTYPNTFTTDANWKPGAWYPPPSTPTDNQNYNVFNVDPYVWFVHQRLGLSGYGFSFDDDVSDIGAGGASAITITYASGPTANPISKQWFPSAPWGNVTAMATISKAGSNPDYPGKSILTVQAADVKAFWQVMADDKANGLVGAYVTGAGIKPGTNLFFNLGSNTLQFVLSGPATPTTTPIKVTFSGYNPTTLTSSPPPVNSPGPVNNPPRLSSSPPVGSTVSNSAPPTLQDLVPLAEEELLMLINQFIGLSEFALGMVSASALKTELAPYQSALNANPDDQTALGQALIDFIQLEILGLLLSPS